jgi:hypothetical protein
VVGVLQPGPLWVCPAEFDLRYEERIKSVSALSRARQPYPPRPEPFMGVLGVNFLYSVRRREA